MTRIVIFPSASGRGVSHLAALVLLVAAGFAVYSNAVPHPFVHDDVVFIQNNPSLGDWSHVSQIFLRSSAYLGPAAANPYYRPLLDLLYKVQFLFFGLDPHAFHLFNVILHIINSILVYGLVVLLLERRGMALAVAALFLVHPVQTEAVACIAGVSNLLFALFCLGSFVLYILARSKRAGPYSVAVYAGSLLLFTAALFAKEQAVILPLVIMLYEYCFPATERWTKLNWVLRQAGLLIVAAGYLFWRQLVLGQAVVSFLDHQGELWLRVLTIPKTILMYVGIIAAPYGLHYYRSADILEPFVWPLVAFVVLAALVITAVRRLPRPDSRPLVFGLGWFFICLLPVINIVPLINEYSWVLTAEHFLYLPLLGFLLFVLGLGGYCFKIIFKDKGGQVAVVLLFLSAVVLGAVSIRQNTYWRGEIPLFERVLKFEHLGRVHILLGKAYYFSGDYRRAAGEYMKAVSVFEEYSGRVKDPAALGFYHGFLKGAHFDIAHCYEATGDLDLALAAYGRAMGYDPNDPVVHNNFALVALKLGEVEEAFSHFSTALELDPRDVMAMTNLATCYIEKKDFVRAEGLLRRALEINGGFAPARQNLEQLLKEHRKVIAQ